MSTDIVKRLLDDPDFDDKIQYEPGSEPTEETPDPNDCGCSMCCGTHVVVNCMGQQRPCDYCACDI